MKFAICNETWFGSGAPDVPAMLARLPVTDSESATGSSVPAFAGFARVCNAIAGHGYDGVEVAPFTLNANPAALTEADAAAFGEIARKAGIEVTGLHWLLLRPPGFHLATPDDDVRRRTTEFARHLARLCAAMGGKTVGGKS